MVMILAIAVVFGLAYAVTHRGRSVAAPDHWRPDTAPASETAHAVGAQLGTQRGAAWNLARAHGRLLLKSEVFIVGIAYWVALVLMFEVLWASDNFGAHNSWRFLFANLPVYALPFAGMTLVACNGATLAARREGVEELFSSLPTTDDTRAVGHIGAVWMALTVHTVFVGAAVVIGRWRTDRFGAIDSASIGDVAVSYVLIACAASLGVALAKWIPHVLASFGMLLALAMVGTGLGGVGQHHWSPTRQLSIWPRYPDHDLLFAVRPNWWHAAYLLGLGALVAAVAVARFRRDFIVGMLALAAGSVALVAGYAQTRPMSAGDAERIADLVRDPLAHSTCQIHDGFRACAYDDYSDATPRWVEVMQQPFAAVPADARREALTVLWREDDLDRLDPEVQKRLDIGLLRSQWASDPISWNAVAVDGEAFDDVLQINVGLWSTGLPLLPRADGQPCSAHGQARAVVAIWVASRGRGDSASQRFVANTRWPDGDPESWQEGYLWDGSPPAPVVWSTTDLGAARAVVGLDAERVKAVLWNDWARWADPSTTTGELLAQLQLGVPSPVARDRSGLTPCP